MTRAASGFGDTLSRWLEAEGIVADDGGAGAIADIPRVRALLIAAAREGRAWSYSGLLAQLGFRFTRPKMRALCRTLDAIDDARGDGEPPLAVLVVREGDGLPGQGWWQGRTDAPTWTGPAAMEYVAERQRAAFEYWSRRPSPRT